MDSLTDWLKFIAIIVIFAVVFLAIGLPDWLRAYLNGCVVMFLIAEDSVRLKKKSKECWRAYFG